MFQDKLFGQAERDKMMRQWGKKPRLAVQDQEVVRSAEVSEVRFRADFKRPVSMWSPEMKRCYNELQARENEK